MKNTKPLGILIFCIIASSMLAQNRNYQVSYHIGVSNSSFTNIEAGEDQISSTFAPTTGMSFQKKIAEDFGLLFDINLALIGSKRTLNTPIMTNGIEILGVKTYCGIISFNTQLKYYLNNGMYIKGGPQYSHLSWVRDDLINNFGDVTRESDIENFNRSIPVVVGGIGYSRKISQSRKQAPVQIDVLWFIELSGYKGLKNIFNNGGANVGFSYIELSTGFTFSSKN